MTTARVSVKVTTRDRLREFANGLGVEYDEAVNFLLDAMINQKDPLLGGRELRERFKREYGEES